MSQDAMRAALNADARRPRAWLYQADQLKPAADLLGTQFQNEANAWLKLEQFGEGEDERRHAAFSLAPAYLMLAGYAIENLAKGLIAVNDLSEAAVEWRGCPLVVDFLQGRIG